MMDYENLNLQHYAGNEYANLSVFNNPEKRELKVRLEELPKQIKNPYKVMKSWLKWEIWDISALLEAITSKHNLESRKNKRMAKREANRRNLTTLNAGSNNLKTIFMVMGSKQQKITQLSNDIAASEEEIDTLINLVQLVTVYLYSAGIPYFRKDRMGVYAKVL